MSANNQDKQFHKFHRVYHRQTSYDEPPITILFLVPGVLGHDQHRQARCHTTLLLIRFPVHQQEQPAFPAHGCLIPAISSHRFPKPEQASRAVLHYLQGGTGMMRNQAARCLWFVWKPTCDYVILPAFHDSPNKISLLLLRSAVHGVPTKMEALFFRLPNTFH